MILSDSHLRHAIEAGEIVVDPLAERAIQPSSIDLRIGTRFRTFKRGIVPIRLDDPTPLEDRMEYVEVPAGEDVVIHPLTFALGVTLERVAVPNGVVGHLEGKSSIGRVGLLIHVTAGYVDPGWGGDEGRPLTLELFNLAPAPIVLVAGVTRVCQIRFSKTTGPASKLYGDPALGSRYTGDGPEVSRIGLPIAATGGVR